MIGALKSTLSCNSKFNSSFRCFATSYSSSRALNPCTTSPKPTPVVVNNGLSSGRLDYVRGWAFQQALLDRRLKYLRENGNGDDIHDHYHDHNRDRILMFEHENVYTLGRGADVENLTFLDAEQDGGIEARKRLERAARGVNSCRLGSDRLKMGKGNKSIQKIVDSMAPISTVHAPNKTPIYRIERGGEVTYHGPGQLVVYPLLNLRDEPYKKDLHWYLRCIEEVIILTLQEFDIHGVRDEINTGVWVNKNKIAAIGLSSARWITTHGFAINVHPNLEMFDTSIIIPCGIEGRGVTSIANEMQAGSPCITDVSNVVLNKMSEVFDVPLEVGDELK